MDKDKQILEFRILKMSLWLALLSTFILFLHDSLFEYSMSDVMIELMGMLLFSTLIWLLAKQHLFNRIRMVFLCVLLLFLDLAWLYSQGLGVGKTLLFFTALLFSQILIQEKYRVHLSLIYFFNMGIILVAEFLSDAQADSRFYSIENPVFEKVTIMIVAFSSVSWLVVYLKREYDKILQKSIAQEQELVRINEEISATNLHLETMVQKRTRSLKEKQCQLIEYAFLNSHSVRSPLSNILGIIEVLKVDDLSKEDLKEMFNYLEIESNRLDQEIANMQNVLHNEGSYDDYHQRIYGGTHVEAI